MNTTKTSPRAQISPKATRKRNLTRSFLVFCRRYVVFLVCRETNNTATEATNYTNQRFEQKKSNCILRSIMLAKRHIATLIFVLSSCRCYCRNTDTPFLRRGDEILDLSSGYARAASYNNNSIAVISFSWLRTVLTLMLLSHWIMVKLWPSITM
jgi:hypothetical protein